MNVTDDGAYVDPDPGHGVPDTAQQLYGRTWNINSTTTVETMSGFIANAVNNTGASWAPDIMKCFAPQNVPIITTLAMEFAVSDNFYAAIPGPTFPNRLMTQSATTWGYGANDVTQTILGWPQESIWSSLTNASVSWRVYFEEAPTALLFQDTRNAAAMGNFKWMSDFVSDVAAGDLPQFTYLDPSYFTIAGLINATDQHPSHDVLDGERLMKTVYESLRASSMWNSTVLIITYDEHGGFYDHVPPPNTGVPSPDGIPCRDCGIPFNFDRLGVRIPLVVVSPWVAKGTLVHNPPASAKPTPTSQMELSSIPATLHQVYNTRSFLTARDAWAVPLNWIWEESGIVTPRTDCPATLPPIPADSSPAFVGKPLQGAAPLTHLQADWVAMMHGVTGGAQSAADVAAANAQLRLTTESAAGLWMRRAMGDKLAEAAAVRAATARKTVVTHPVELE